jgi:hypothetical protein
MKQLSFFSRLLLTSLFCFALAAPASAAADKAAAPAKSAAPAKKAPAAKKPEAAGAAHSAEAIQKKLDIFAAETIGKLNRNALPSLNKKEVKKNADGSFTARYIEIDPSSAKTSYKKPDNPGSVTYIGYMTYNEIEYHCTAPSKEAAEKGPFSIKTVKNLTELVKYLHGKWTY